MTPIEQIQQLARTTLLTGALHDFQITQLKLFGSILFAPAKFEVHFLPGGDADRKRSVEYVLAKCPVDVPGSLTKVAQGTKARLAIAEQVRMLLGSDVDVVYKVGKKSDPYPATKAAISPADGETTGGDKAVGGGAEGAGGMAEGPTSGPDRPRDGGQDAPALPAGLLDARHPRRGGLPRLHGGGGGPSPRLRSMG